MSAADRASLEQRLAELLHISIDDDRSYVSDIMGSLIDIGEAEDISEYLTSFGADDENALRRFSCDVIKFKLGEEICHADADESSGPATAAHTASRAKPKPKILDEGAARREEIKRREADARRKQREEQDRTIRRKEEEERRRRREAAAATKKRQPEAKARVDQKGRNENSQPRNGKTPSDAEKVQSRGIESGCPSGPADAKKNEPKGQEPKEQESKGQERKTKPHRPERGKPKRSPCGCFGTKNKPVTNCLRCGRISCEAEGTNDYCHFCGWFIGDVSHPRGGTGDERVDSALRHKERLLEFDRQSAARTHIHDDQEDYFEASTSMWSTRQEREDARAMEEDRKDRLHARRKQVLTVEL